MVEREGHVTTSKPSSLNRIDRGGEIAIGPVFFIIAILGILASAIAVGGETLAKTRAIPETVTIKMPVEQDAK